MILRICKPEELSELTRISKEAFDTDILVGNPESGGPPGYDSLPWHRHMMESGKLYTALSNDEIVGGAVIFPDAPRRELYIGRIFIDPAHFLKGYGVAVMEQIERQFPGYLCKLDTPIWNDRTNRFYQKLGYRQARRDEETVFYEKKRSYEEQ